MLTAIGVGLLAASGLTAPGQAPGAGGVFRYSLDLDIDYVDPALAYHSLSWEVLYATCSMLVGYPDAPAPRGARLVPDGAAAMPAVSPDGRTYTFRVRAGRRLSDGTPITARSYERALERVLHRMIDSPGRRFYADIVGAKAFTNGRARRIRGLALLSGNRLRIRLERRAPDFLARLAMPFACAVKADLPVVFQGVGAPVAGSGPYYVAGWERGRRIVVRRNPHYRGTRPQNLAAVVYDIGLPPASIKLRIDRGETDHGPISPVAHAELGLRHGVRRSSPGRYFVNPGLTLRYLALNHERELFGKPGGGREAGLGNVRLKQAVNFAIDRTAMVGQLGAYAASFNDQYLPAAMPGFRNAAIYPTRPDLTRARELARGSTRGGKARLHTESRRPNLQLAQIVKANLGEIGIDVEIWVSLICCRPDPSPRGEPFDIRLEAWRADYFDPNDYLFLLDGRTIRPAYNTNISYFDSPEYNRKLARAASLTGQARYRAFGALDLDLARNAAPLASYATDNDRRYFSARVRGFFAHPVYGLDLAAIDVR